MNKKILFFVLLFFSALRIYPAKQDAYDKLAKELSESASQLERPKVAILSFSYADGRKSPGGNIVSERLTTRIVKLKKLQVIERQLLDKVLQELHLETTGVVDAETTKQLGKVLGVDAIITGSLLDIENNKVEVNARVIKTDTAEVITTASVEIEKIWTDVSPTLPSEQQVQPQQPLYQPVVTPPYQQVKKGPTGNFIDIFIGPSNATMDLKFESDSYSIGEVDLSLDLNGSGTLDSNVKHRKINFEKLETKSVVMPIGIRIGGFTGKSLIGFDFLLSYLSRELKKQNTSVTYDDYSTYGFSFYRDGYIKVSMFAMSIDLLLRFSSRQFQPYMGIGIGLSINNTYSPYIYQYRSWEWEKPLNEFSLGFLYNIPLGIRFTLDENTSLFAEYRYTYNTFGFDRGTSNETNNINLSISQFLFGVGFNF